MSTPDDSSPAPSGRRLPWALYPKIVCVSLLLGGFVCVLVLVLTTPLENLDDWRGLLANVSPLFKLVIVPGSFATVVFSLLLFWPRRRQLLRERWLQLKLALLVLTLPALHIAARNVFTAMRREVEAGSPEGPTGLLQFFTALVLMTIALLLVAMWLGRFKPGGRRSRPASPQHT